MKINFLTVSFSTLLASSSFAYDFPMGLIEVNQTYGDFNTTIYHDGIDLPGTKVGQEVRLPIHNGKVIWKDSSRTHSNGYVCVQDTTTLKIFAFGHIEPDAAITTGTIIPQNTLLGVLQEFLECAPKTEQIPRLD